MEVFERKPAGAAFHPAAKCAANVTVEQLCFLLRVAVGEGRGKPF